MLTLYLVVVSGLSLLAFYFGAILGFDELIASVIAPNAWTSGTMAIKILGYVLVAGLLWGFHWTFLQNRPKMLSGDWVGMFRFYLAIVVGAMALGIYAHGGGMLSAVVDIFETPDRDTWSQFASVLVSLALSLSIWIYHLRVFIANYNTKQRRITR